MTAFTKFLAGGVAIAALASAAPAAAQYYPGSGYGGGGDIIGQVISSVIGGGLGTSGYGYNQGYNGYNQGYNQGYAQNPYGRYGQAGQYAINQCMGAVQQRLNAGYANNGYNGGYSNGYGYQQQQYGGARVLGVSDIEQRSNGGLSIRGVANSGRNAGYAYGYGNGYAGQGQGQVDLTFKCKTDASGYIVDIDIEQATSANGYSNQGYGNQGYTPYNQDYSQYGYRRY